MNVYIYISKAVKHIFLISYIKRVLIGHSIWINYKVKRDDEKEAFLRANNNKKKINSMINP